MNMQALFRESRLFPQNSNTAQLEHDIFHSFEPPPLGGTTPIANTSSALGCRSIQFSLPF
jgi:hypothetical protein